MIEFPFVNENLHVLDGLFYRNLRVNSSAFEDIYAFCVFQLRVDVINGPTEVFQALGEQQSNATAIREEKDKGTYEASHRPNSVLMPP